MNNKVYSLDTYREAIHTMSKDKAIEGSVINDQKGLDQHFDNIQYVKDKVRIDNVLFNPEDVG